MLKLQNYINGELIEPVSKKYLDNYNPSTGKVYSLIPDSDEKDVQLAVDAAQAAFPKWSVTKKEDFGLCFNIERLDQDRQHERCI